MKPQRQAFYDIGNSFHRKTVAKIVPYFVVNFNTANSSSESMLWWDDLKTYTFYRSWLKNPKNKIK